MVAKVIGGAVVAFVGSAGAYDADAQTSPIAPSVRVSTGQLLQTSPTPWEQLFRAQPSDADARRLAKQALQERVAEADERPPCTMPIVEVTSDLDPHMVMPLPEDQPVPRMPVIEPSCRPRKR
jgi:hypothetical protein